MMLRLIAIALIVAASAGGCKPTPTCYMGALSDPEGRPSKEEQQQKDKKSESHLRELEGTEKLSSEVASKIRQLSDGFQET